MVKTLEDMVKELEIKSLRKIAEKTRVSDRKLTKKWENYFELSFVLKKMDYKTG